MKTMKRGPFGGQARIRIAKDVHPKQRLAEQMLAYSQGYTSVFSHGLCSCYRDFLTKRKVQWQIKAESPEPRLRLESELLDQQQIDTRGLFMQLNTAAERKEWGKVNSILQVAVEGGRRHRRGKGNFAKLEQFDMVLGSIDKMMPRQAQLRTVKALLRTYIKAGSCNEAVQVLKWMNKNGFVPSVKDYSSVINMLLKSSKGNRGQSYNEMAYKLWNELCETDSELDGAAIRAGMNACVMTGRLNEAEMIFEDSENDELKDRSYNILIKGYAREKELTKLKEIIQRMENDGIKPIDSTYKSLISAYMTSGRSDLAMSLLKEVKDSVDKKAKLEMYNIVLKGMILKDDIGKAVDMMDSMKVEGIQPDQYAYSQLMDSLIRKNDIDGAEALFDQMIRQSIVPNVVTYNILLRGYCMKRWERANALRLLKQMKDSGIKPNTSTFNTLIGAAIKHEDNQAATRLFQLMVDLDVRPDKLTFTKIIKSFGDQRMPEEAERVFAQLERSSVGGADCIAFNCLIAAYGKSGKMREAQETLRKMIQNGVKPDKITFNSIVRASCATKDFKTAVVLIKRAAGMKVQIALSLYDTVLKQCILQEKYGWATEVLHSMKAAGVNRQDLRERELFVNAAQEGYSQYKSEKRSEDNAVALERVKFWVGLPNKYYSDQ